MRKWEGGLEMVGVRGRSEEGKAGFYRSAGKARSRCLRIFLAAKSEESQVVEGEKTRVGGGDE